jgi:hypothetical protein
MIKHVVADLAGHQERRAAIAARRGAAREVLAAGAESARGEARTTMAEVRSKLGFGAARDVC